ncbi:immunity protein Tsi6 family protein [Erwinia mallotivora]|uniref:Tsi6 domain-containing protein n=1 Tax=Erwinia mallotivora TaxID=69222 RepID=A0A014MH20_9GAMM|nr:immunity protein Tsi6 family protein [Erwinia mallotivora]EXU77414.1 hypothetical protein BG55_22900 [Erwinia mallotivora]
MQSLKNSRATLNYVTDAISIVELRLKKNPDFNLYVMALNQLRYVQAVLTGAEKDKSKLHTMNLGVLASKEFDTSDPDLAKNLSNVNYIASQMAGGLKIILPHEEDPEYIKRQKR